MPISRILACAAALLLACSAAQADGDTNGRRTDFGGDRFVAGGSVTVDEPVAGDLIAAGGSLDVDAPVGGDVVMVGGRARFSAAVAGSVYAGGGQLSVASTIGRNLRAAAGRVELAPTGEVKGNVTVAGGTVQLRGRVGGHVQVGGGSVLIDGPVAGNVSVSAGQLELGPNARIGGKLRWRGSDSMRQDPGAEVLGGIERLEMRMPRRDDADERGTERGHMHFETSSGGWFWTAGLVLLAVLLRAALPRFFTGVSERLQERPALSLGAGFLLLVATPLAALVLLFTLVGAPVALLVVAAWLTLLPVGYATAGIALGHWSQRRWGADSGRGWALMAAGLAMLAVSLLGRLPFVGGWIVFAALLLGLGALVLQLRAAAATG